MKEVQFTIEGESINSLKGFLSLLHTGTQDHFQYLKLWLNGEELTICHISARYEAYWFDNVENREKTIFSGVIKLSLLQNVLTLAKKIDLKHIIGTSSLEIIVDQKERFLFPLTSEDSFLIKDPERFCVDSVSLSSDIFQKSWNFLSGLSEDEERSVNFIITGKNIDSLSYSITKAGWFNQSLNQELNIEGGFVLTQKQFATLGKMFRLGSNLNLVLNGDLKIKGENFLFKMRSAVDKAMSQHQILKLFETGSEFYVKVDSSEMLRAINRVKIVLSKAGERIEFETKGNNLEIKAYSPINGEAFSSISILEVGKPISFKCESEKISDFIRRIKGDLNIKLIKERKAVILSTESIQYLFLHD